MPQSQLPKALTIIGLAILVVILAIYFLSSQITPRTNLSLAAGAMDALKIPPADAAFLSQTDSGNAGDVYRSAADAYHDASRAVDQFEKNPTGDTPKIIADILAAEKKPCMQIFAGDAQAIVNYQSEHAPLENLKSLGESMDRIGLRLKKSPEQAMEYFQAVYAMGWGLTKERLNYDEYMVGMGLMDDAATGLSDALPAAPASAALALGIKERIDFDAAHVTPIYSVIISIDPQTVAQNAGDVFAFATDSKERMFKVEAILKLGRYRFNAARGADQVAAPKTIANQANDPDPAVRAAAKAAGELTVEEYRTIH